MKLLHGLIISLFVILGFACSKQSNNKVQFFCAASLTEVMTAMVDSFNLENNQGVELNFASSGTLARQIQLGAGADVFLSANKEWVDFLIEESVVRQESVAQVAGNSLVLISGLSAKGLQISQAIKERFVIGDPATVPVGNYAKMALVNLNLWEPTQSFLYGRDAKQVVKLVELGEAEFGIVYKTDAMSSDKVKMVLEVPDSCYNPVKYYMCNLNHDSSSSEKLLKFIRSDKGKSIWRKFGFKSN